MTAAWSQDLHLRCELPSVTRGRHFVRDVLAERGLSRVIEDAELGVSELIANAVRHARTDLTLTIAVDRTVTIAVTDGYAALDRPVNPETSLVSESGRGLRIVAAISHNWGVQALPGGKRIWFELPLPDRSTADADLFSLAQHRHTGRATADRTPPSAGDAMTAQARSAQARTAHARSARARIVS